MIAAAALELAPAHRADVGAHLGGVHRRVEDVPLLAAGAGDEDGVDALGVVAGDGAGALRGLVVGVGVDRQQAQLLCHITEHAIRRARAPRTPSASGRQSPMLEGERGRGPVWRAVGLGLERECQ